jgi:iron complex transport system ATP-binding protein
MNSNPSKILSIEEVLIGFITGKTVHPILPPLTAGAGKGELIAVIGRNGIGKSTLLRTIAGLQKPIGGDIFYGNRRINEYSRMELAQNVSYISTEVLRPGNMTVYELVALGRYPYTNWTGRINNENNEAILDALNKCSIASFSDRLVGELSDGERQRAMIARILAQDTGIMVMDEPTAFLDVSGRYEILHLMHNISRKSSKSIIFSTHDLQSAVSQADKIWLMLDDMLIEGAPEDLMIKGSFDKLFNLPAIQFNSVNGTFTFQTGEKGKIHIKGDGIRKYWIEKAINRAGYISSATMTDPFIIILQEENEGFVLVQKGREIGFSSVYDLLNHISGST